jgi:hypothetical protein
MRMFLFVILSEVEGSQFLSHCTNRSLRDFSTSLEMTTCVQNATGLNAGENAHGLGTFNEQRLSSTSIIPRPKLTEEHEGGIRFSQILPASNIAGRDEKQNSSDRAHRFI